MREFLKEKKASKEYKKQKKFILFDCGKGFTYRYGVMGTYCELYKLTRYFADEKEACDYFDAVMKKTKNFFVFKGDKTLDKWFAQSPYKLKNGKRRHRLKKQRFCALKEHP